MVIGNFKIDHPPPFAQLSDVKQTVLRLLLACLSRVAKEGANKMDSTNLAVCFAPTLCGLTEVCNTVMMTSRSERRRVRKARSSISRGRT